ncbi:MAG: 1-acyl-sn-glycerol-3-phosphate acyltransferase [Eubacterium sp.]|nr:1-acyl-sn-glycerol-3-phosphate acyltransferase [Eubacterium sp.]
MAILRNIPTLIKVLGSISSLDRYSKGILEAREAGDPVKEREVIGEDIKIWANKVADEFSLTIEVENPENIPEQDGCVYIANHQGYADIVALIVALDGRQIGFIAKDSLEKVPYLGKWIKLIRGLFIKRGDNREALKSMREGIDLVKKGYNLAIFPEGTRSRGPKMGKFKAGSFKLATKAKAPIVPVSISGSYKCFEEKGYHQPATIKVMFHPPIETKDLSRQDIMDIEKEIPSTIQNGLSMMS